MRARMSARCRCKSVSEKGLGMYAWMYGVLRGKAEK